MVRRVNWAIWLDHGGSLRYCDVWTPANIKFEGEEPERHLKVVYGMLSRSVV